MISFNFVLIINSKLFTGKKPPEEIKVNDKLNELKALKSDKYKIKKILVVSNKYIIPNLKHCFIVSLELKLTKSVKVFKYVIYNEPLYMMMIKMLMMPV